jgi:uncharacterized protein (UPF0332 family)
MSFDWSEYLHLAQELTGQAVTPPSQEAKLRSAISRAYYAAFCLARNHLLDKGYPVPTDGRAHKYVPQKFKSRPDLSHRQIGENLDRLREDRRKADYDNVVSGLPSKTRMAIKLAKQAISTLGNL